MLPYFIGHTSGKKGHYSIIGNLGYTYGFSLSTYNRTSTGYLNIQNLLPFGKLISSN